jgi:light-regulated signal transduction histidine kinase (bacteriophytochrome)
MPYHAEYRTRWPDGSIHWLDARGRYYYDDSGLPIRMLGVIVDITQRKEAEEALLRANEELQQFAYAASHDLHEPLRTVAIYTEMLIRREVAAERRLEWLQTVLDSARRMQALIDGLLALSRTGPIRMFRQAAVDANQVLESTLATIKATLDEHGASVEYEDLPVVNGDPAQIAQVFQNLVSNAVKYRRDSEPPRIRVSAERQGSMWRFAFNDNGQGFRSEYQDHIFQPFKRLHGPEIPGTGIGLALCKRIVERHGGRIWADATPGGGATFYFTLPEAAGVRVAAE